MSALTLKQEIVECIAEEYTPCCTDNMYPSGPLESSEYVNYYDSKDVLEQLKRERPGEEFPQSYCILDKTFSENKGLIKVTCKQEVQHENIDKRSSSNIKEEEKEIDYQLTSKVEKLEDQGILDNAKDTSTHYDVKLTPQEDGLPLQQLESLQTSPKQIKQNGVHCKYCNAEYKYRKALDKHTKLCRKKNLTVHNKRSHYDYRKMFICWCGKRFRSLINLDMHMRMQHALKDIDEEKKYKCEQCEAIFTLNSSLRSHVKTIHYDENNDLLQCGSCQKLFKTKQSLTVHLKRFHYDYGNLSSTR